MAKPHPTATQRSSSMCRSAVAFVVVTVVGCVAGCTVGEGEGEGEGAVTGEGEGEDVVVFPADALVVVDSNSGRHVELRSSPQPPPVGFVPFALRVVDDEGAGVAGLDLAVRPWMPLHGHGPTVQPNVSDEGDGTYQLREVDLIMAGDWELQVTIDGGADFVAPAFPVQ